MFIYDTMSLGLRPATPESLISRLDPLVPCLSQEIRPDDFKPGWLGALSEAWGFWIPFFLFSFSRGLGSWIFFVFSFSRDFAGTSLPSFPLRRTNGALKCVSRLGAVFGFG